MAKVFLIMRLKHIFYPNSEAIMGAFMPVFLLCFYLSILHTEMQNKWGEAIFRNNRVKCETQKRLAVVIKNVLKFYK